MSGKNTTERSAIMLWVATVDAGTCEISDFERATEKDVLYLLDGYKVNMSNPTKFRLRDLEGGHHIVYEGVTYTVWGFKLRVHIDKNNPKDWRVTGFNPTGDGWDEMLTAVHAINDELDRHYY